MQRQYSDEEADQILRHAARLTGKAEGMTFEALRAAASEAGISEEALAQAEREILAQQAEAEERAAYKKSLNEKLRAEVASWLSVSLMLYGINFMTSGMRFNPFGMWATWVFGIWGLAVMVKFVEHAIARPDRNEEAFAKWRKKHRKRAEQLPPPRP